MISGWHVSNTAHLTVALGLTSDPRASYPHRLLQQLCICANMFPMTRKRIARLIHLETTLWILDLSRVRPSLAQTLRASAV